MKTLLLIVVLALLAFPVLAQTQTLRHGVQNGLVLAYTDQAGVAHANAFWVPAQVTIDNLDGNGSIQWVAFDSTTAWAAGDQPIGGASHLTQINSTNLTALKSLSGQSTFAATLAAGIAYLVANVLDTQEVTGGVPQVDSNNNPVMVSFFAGSTATTASN